jgi:F0F1-type ATP synthase membrane subunit b/b'
MKSMKEIIKLRKGEMKTIATAAEKIAAQRGIQELQQRSNDLQREQFQAQTDIAGQKKTLLDDLEKEIEQQLHVRELFTVQWRII